MSMIRYVCFRNTNYSIGMARREEIKQYDAVLQKYVGYKEYVKIHRTICDKEDNLSGFILNFTKSFYYFNLTMTLYLAGMR